jgi:chitinase
MYYEIMALLKQHPDLEPIHDKEAAVKYVTFGGDQWVSFDDADTFKQKIEWANNIGIGGSLIWASDTDDDQYSAMSGLIGRKVSHADLSQAVFDPTPANIAENLVGQNGQDCKRLDECVDPDIVRCPDGYTKVGFDQDKCGVSWG